jgi:hypothetical protein
MIKKKTHTQTYIHIVAEHFECIVCWICSHQLLAVYSNMSLNTQRNAGTVGEVGLSTETFK